jgi:heme-degrading monooxygenase HmoA
MGIQYFIDKFLVPKNGVQEFKQRMAYNRQFLRRLPGFVEDAAYERTDANGDLVVVTVAKWESEEAVKNAKGAVQAEYQRIGFDAAEMYARLKIQAPDRGVYTKVEG